MDSRGRLGLMEQDLCQMMEQRLPRGGPKLAVCLRTVLWAAEIEVPQVASGF